MLLKMKGNGLVVTVSDMGAYDMDALKRERGDLTHH